MREQLTTHNELSQHHGSEVSFRHDGRTIWGHISVVTKRNNKTYIYLCNDVVGRKRFNLKVEEYFEHTKALCISYSEGLLKYEHRKQKTKLITVINRRKNNMKITKELVQKYVGCVYDDGGIRGIIVGFDSADSIRPVLLNEASHYGEVCSKGTASGWGSGVTIFKHWKGLSPITWVTDFDTKYIEEPTNTQPKLEPGMIIVLKCKDNDLLYTCLHISDKWNPSLDNRGFCDLTLNYYDIVEIYHCNRRGPLNTIDTKFATLIWKKEEDKKVKLQEKLDALEESHKKAVAEIKAELKEL